MQVQTNSKAPKEVTGLYLDPASGQAKSIKFCPDLKGFHRELDCSLIGGGTITDVPGTSTTIVEESANDYTLPGIMECRLPVTLNPEIWGHEHMIWGPIIITGPVDDEGEHTSITRKKAEAVLQQVRFTYVDTYRPAVRKKVKKYELTNWQE